MIRRWLRRGVVLGLFVAAGYAVVRFLRGAPVPAFSDSDSGAAPAAARPSAPRPIPPIEATPPESWIEPADGITPSTHPVKVKLTSGIYHMPGSRNYERLNADRYYPDGPAAEADGFRPSKI